MTLVVGVDGSDASKNALRWAVEEARLRRAPLVALHAWEPPIIVPDLSPAPTVDLPAVVAEAEQGATRILERTVEEVVGEVSGVEIRPVVVEGAPAQALIDAVKDAELLVVGSRGHGGFGALLLGSVSMQCALHAACPVVIHRA